LPALQARRPIIRHLDNRRQALRRHNRIHHTQRILTRRITQSKFRHIRPIRIRPTRPPHPRLLATVLPRMVLHTGYPLIPPFHPIQLIQVIPHTSLPRIPLTISSRWPIQRIRPTTPRRIQIQLQMPLRRPVHRRSRIPPILRRTHQECPRVPKRQCDQRPLLPLRII